MTGYNFTNDVRRALQRAREEAAALRQGQVAPEHLLLGLLRHPGAVSAAVFEELHVDPDALFRQMVAATTSPVVSESAGPDLPYTDGAKKVLELAMAEARDLNHPYVGTEHLLLGLVREGPSSASAVLTGAGFCLPNTRDAVKRLAPASPRPASDQTARRALLLAVAALIIAVIALFLALRTYP